MYSLGFDWEAVDFFSFIAEVAEGDDDLQIMYGIGGERDLTESTLDHLPGYADSRPVRIGNAAYAQRQHDVWGALLDSVYLHAQAVDHLDNRIWPILDRQVGQALKHWREPDAGIWEVRGELRHFTSSKIMCWVAVDRGARLARMNGDDRQGGASGTWPPTRSRRTSSGTASTTAACSPSTTAAPLWTPRSSWRHWCASSRPTTHASGQRCWRSATS